MLLLAPSVNSEVRYVMLGLTSDQLHNASCNTDVVEVQDKLWQQYNIKASPINYTDEGKVSFGVSPDCSLLRNAERGLSENLTAFKATPIMETFTFVLCHPLLRSRRVSEIRLVLSLGMGEYKFN